MYEYTRRVGDRGQVTIPKELRERHRIESGDDVVFVETNSDIQMKLPIVEDRLADGYNKRSERSRDLAREMEAASIEATERLSEAPEWTDCDPNGK